MRFVLTLALVIMLSGCSKAPYDSTDNPPQRSGLTVYKDNLTGCEYIQARSDTSITPRMAAEGKQVGCR